MDERNDFTTQIARRGALRSWQPCHDVSALSPKAQRGDRRYFNKSAIDVDGFRIGGCLESETLPAAGVTYSATTTGIIRQSLAHERPGCFSPDGLCAYSSREFETANI